MKRTTINVDRVVYSWVGKIKYQISLQSETNGSGLTKAVLRVFDKYFDLYKSNFGRVMGFSERLKPYGYSKNSRIFISRNVMQKIEGKGILIDFLDDILTWMYVNENPLEKNRLQKLGVFDGS